MTHYRSGSKVFKTEKEARGYQKACMEYGCGLIPMCETPEPVTHIYLGNYETRPVTQEVNPSSEILKMYNKMRKEEHELITYVAENFCDKYCKYPELYADHILDTICSNCPMNKLLEVMKNE